MIGDDSESGAFVFGAYSFLDKMANGVVLYMITVGRVETGVWAGGGPDRDYKIRAGVRRTR